EVRRGDLAQHGGASARDGELEREQPHLLVLLEPDEQGVDRRLGERPPVGARLQRRDHGLRRAHRDAAAHGAEHRVLVVEAVVHGAERDAGLLRHAPHGHGLDALAQRDAQARLDDLGAALVEGLALVHTAPPPTAPGPAPGAAPGPPSYATRAVAAAAMPSPRPVRPSASVVVAVSETGAPAAADSAACASSRRVPTRGWLPITWTATLPMMYPAARTRLAASLSQVVPEAPARSGRPVPKCGPRSPSPAAANSASAAACAATSASEWPARPRSPGQCRPPSQSSRSEPSGAKACTSTPMPVRGRGTPG